MSSTSASSTCHNHETVGRRFKRPVSVLVVVATRGGEVLLMERTQPRGFWQSVTGSLRDEETPAEAARRELAEETGIAADAELENCHLTNHFPIIAAWRHRYAANAHYNREHVFRLTLENRIAVRLNPREHLGYKWMTRDQAAAQADSWTNRTAILALTGGPLSAAARRTEAASHTGRPSP